MHDKETFKEMINESNEAIRVGPGVTLKEDDDTIMLVSKVLESDKKKSVFPYNGKYKGKKVTFVIIDKNLPKKKLLIVHFTPIETKEWIDSDGMKWKDCLYGKYVSHKAQ